MIQAITKLGDALLSRVVPHVQAEAAGAAASGCYWENCLGGVRRCCPTGCGTCLHG
jgi:hypothetical protein